MCVPACTVPLCESEAIVRAYTAYIYSHDDDDHLLMKIPGKKHTPRFCCCCCCCLQLLLCKRSMYDERASRTRMHLCACAGLAVRVCISECVCMCVRGARVYTFVVRPIINYALCGKRVLCVCCCRAPHTQTHGTLPREAKI